MKFSSLHHLKKRIVYLLAIGMGTTLGIGFFPRMPGTIGSLFALALYWIFFPAESSILIHAFFFGIILLVFFAGVWSATILEKRYGHDPSCVVIDEAAGMALALLFLPKQAGWALAAFVLFRFLDIVKWLGINALQRLRGGWGVMMDDVLAGIWTNLIVHSMIWINRLINES